MELVEKMELKESYLCLNMIVKNESHIIKETLTKLLNKIPLIDYWVISDTGSTDKTKEIILNFFKERNIKGEIFDDEWTDFGHNRTLALEHAYNKSKYLLVFDADDEICGDFVLPELNKDSYHFQFGDANGTSYTRTQIINNKKKWKYVGILHEIITCTDFVNGLDIIKGKYYTVSGKSGARSRDPNKYLKDALILEKGYEEAIKKNDELYNRYGFYCANSYYDSGKWEDAIKWYKITLGNKNWDQEKYISCLRLYNCYNSLNQKETGMFYLVKSFSYDKERVECLYELVSYYCCNDMNEIAYNYYNIVKSFYNERYLKDGLNNKLFLDVSKANLFLPYYMILVSDKVNDHDTTIQMYRIIFTKKHIERSKHYIGNMLYNLQFFIERVKDDSEFLRLFQEYIEFLISINYPIYDHIDFMVKYEKYGILLPKISGPNFYLDDCLKSKNILLYSGYSPSKWNYTFSLGNALGGSETAIASLTKNFPEDYTIYVAGEVEEETVENIRYVHFNNLNNLIKTTAFHTIIVSRYLNFYELYRNFSAYQTFIWGHDITLYAYGTDLSVESILTKWSSKITGCICQTEWHKNLFLSSFPQLKDKITTINNGINANMFSNTKVKKVTNRFIYTSCSERGLYKLVQLWSSILENLPDAELVISSYNNFPNSEEDNKILEIINKTQSIKHMGKLNRSELYNLMSSAEYWLYTSYFQETSCITSLELLASEVICLYYPVAGLVNTLGVYGIPVSEGSELDTLLSLTIKRKIELKKKGKEYALSCSWKNRADEWVNRMNFANNNDKIAIFNSLPFHYEMFGFILNYAKKHNINVDIFTNTTNNMGWLSFYKNKFSNFIILDIENFKLNVQKYKYIFVTTDDDAYIMNKDVSYDNIILINHFWKIRNPYGKRYLNCAPFKDSKLDFCYPNYPIFNVNDKNTQNNITIVGGGEVIYSSLKYNIDVINRFSFNNGLPIILNFICRGLSADFLKGLSDKFKLNIYSDIDTNKMMDILKDSNYIYVTFSNCNDKNSGHSCSGAIQLAFNTLCKPIILKETNQIFNINNCIEYTNENNTPIYLEPIDFNALENERNIYIKKFEDYLDKYKYYFKYDDITVNLLKDDNNKEIYKNFYKRANCEPMLRKLMSYLWQFFIDKNIIDLGSWIGDNTIPWALKSKGIIYAIDPSVENLNNINKLVEINNLKNVVTMNYTISDRFGQVYSNEHDLTHISCNESKGVHKLDTVTLDYLNLENIGLIHLDVEGFEQKVLNGSKQMIQKYKPIIIWENHINTDDYNYTINYLNDYGYETYMINELLPGCFTDCRNFISFVDSKFDIDKINNHFKDVYFNFCAYKNKDFLIKMNQPIPKQIIQTWEHKELSLKFQKIVDTWKIQNPGYDYKLLDKNEREQFIKDNFDIDVLNAYNSIVPGANKADLFRYCYLYIKGGIYIDIDSLCIGKLDTFLIQDVDFIVPIDFNINLNEGQHNIACGFIASRAKHPILLYCINQIVKNITNKIIPTSKLDFTGPGILGRCVNKYLGNKETTSFIGKEGIIKHIYFLKFEPVTEYVKDLNNNILFQNKNGNLEIISLYNDECNKLSNFVSWVNCPYEKLFIS